MKLRYLAFALLLAGLVSCQSKTEEESTEETTTTTATQTTGVSFVKLDGSKVDLGALKGKTVVLNFWATWCPPCIKEMPSLQAFYNKYQGDSNVEFLVIEVDNKPDLAQRFIDNNKFTFPVYSPAGPVPSEYLGDSIPTTVVLDKTGKVVYRHEGMSDFMAPDFLAKFESFLAN